MAIIDAFLLLKYVVILIESSVYSQSFPPLILIYVVFKFLLQLAIVVVEWPFIFKKLNFHLCKITYALKFVEIIFVLFQALCYRNML